MKRCPECLRDYYDDSLLYCLEDGNVLLPGTTSAEERARGVSTVPDSGEDAVTRILDSTPPEEGFWIAVLPFKYRGNDPDLTALAEAMAEDIVSGLARFSYLRVISNSSTLRYGSDSGDVRLIGRELGARYVMEGSLRQSGLILRIAVRLVDAKTGANVWSESYERSFSPGDVFELEDDLVPRIVSTVADPSGALAQSMSDLVRSKLPHALSPYEALLRSFGYFGRLTPEDHAAARAALEHAVKLAPGNADCWAMLSMIYGEEHRFSFNLQSDPLGRALHAARSAVDASPANHAGWLALAQALFFRKEFDTFREAAERAVELNPMDGFAVEFLGHLIAFAGNWERGYELSERARQLNPNHPGWYWAIHFLNAYRQGDYQTARSFALKFNQPGHFFAQALVAAVYGQLGEIEAATQTLQTVLRLRPDFGRVGRDEFAKWYSLDLVEQLMDGLHKAGLKEEARQTNLKSETSS